VSVRGWTARRQTNRTAREARLAIRIRLTVVAGAMCALALLCSAGSLAGRATTEPGHTLVVYIIMDDKKIRPIIYRVGANDSGGQDLTFEPVLIRGDVATFIVLNRGKKPHGVTLFGKKTGPLKPGARVRLDRRALLYRGSLPYSSTTDRGKAFKGVIPIV
jgi:hypothetical protein